MSEVLNVNIVPDATQQTLKRLRLWHFVSTSVNWPKGGSELTLFSSN